ncbi:hypothetical protein B0O99DRAFT_362132 [Bisporella sp. PMI_857]|nr:hypothetical protein B0O99DRAFT_362132 [Bisporella sp. PMI_857]
MTLVKKETARSTASPVERRMNFAFNAGTGGFTTTKVDRNLAGDMDIREEHISEHTGAFILDGSTQSAKLHKSSSDASPDEISSPPKLCSTETNGKKYEIDSKSQSIGDIAGDKIEPRNSCTDETSDEAPPDPERKSKSANQERYDCYLWVHASQRTVFLGTWAAETVQVKSLPSWSRCVYVE